MSNSEYRAVSVGNWIITFIVVGIPLVNLIMLIIWALGGTPHPSKKTFAQAFLVLLAISFCISLLIALLWPAVFHHHRGVAPPVG
ncbi:MAG TPA: hypothetical protein VME24_02565 [Alphaproteobacteria bacterium]|nr:hypothetical protein [Alphaproteobacteria bacterium]